MVFSVAFWFAGLVMPTHVVADIACLGVGLFAACLSVTMYFYLPICLPLLAMTLGHGLWQLISATGLGHGSWPWLLAKALGQALGNGSWPRFWDMAHGHGPWPWRSAWLLAMALGHGSWSWLLAMALGHGIWPGLNIVAYLAHFLFLGSKLFSNNCLSD